MNSLHTNSAISIVAIAACGLLFLGCAGGPLYSGQYRPVPVGVTASPQPSIWQDALGGVRHVVQLHERQAGIGIAESTEPLLDQSGFESMPVDAAGEQSVVAGLAPFRINQLGHDHRIEYWFYDPAFCKCAYEGDEIAYATFEQAEKHQQQEQAERRYLVDSRRQVYWPMNSQWDPVEGWWSPDSRKK